MNISTLSRKQVALILVALAIVAAVASGAWSYRAYQNAYALQVEAKKTEIAKLLRGQAAGVLTADFFVAPASQSNQDIFRGIFERIQSPTIFRMKVWNSDQVVV